MAAPKGNQFWKARSKHGRDKIFSSSIALWEACCEYFQWVEENPLWETKSYQFQGEPFQDKVPKMRAMTIDGICLFLGISTSSWHSWKNDKSDSNKDFLEVITRAESVMRSQKFSGAAADLLNANIIARDLGLTDKKDHTSSDGSMSPPKKHVYEIIDPAND